MRLRGRQGRFIATVAIGWVGARTWLLWPAGPVAAVPAGPAAAMPLAPRPAASLAALIVAPAKAEEPTTGFAPPPSPTVAVERRRDDGVTRDAAATDAPPRPVARDRPNPGRPPLPGETPPLPLLPAPIAALRAAIAALRAIEASAYLFVRPGGGRAPLAPGGTLGGSQIAARIALPLGRVGPVRAAIAGRFYAPLSGKGAETALGIDLHPLRDNPLRLSIERRIGLDAAGRDAWSAYAAGGFYAEPRAKLVIDGYAQAGIVGLHARDPFADGALRIGRRAGRLTLGAGLWGAAQPGAERLDAGPRAALALPVATHSLTLAIEGRLRIAGHAAPGSGAALTLATDF